MRITCFALMIGLALLLAETASELTAQEAGQPTLAPPKAKAPAGQASQKDKATEDKATEDKAVEDKAVEDKAVEDKAVGSKPSDEKSAAEKNSKGNEPEPIDVDELLRQLEMVIRDPFSPDRAIAREQRKANNEFVEVTASSSLPVLELVCYAERSVEGSDELEQLVGLKIEGRVYFVRKGDQVTLPRTAGNLVIQISSIEKGFVEVKIGTLQESIIVR
jgi:hypothetical protein